MNESPTIPRLSPEVLLSNYLGSRSEQAFSQLIQQLGGLVYGSAYRRTGDSFLSEEIAQNVFTILFHKAESLRHHPSLSAWLHQTTRFEAEKALRREGRHRRRLETFTQEHMNDPNSPAPITAETLRLLEQSIDQLGKADRELLLARFFEGKKFQEIATQTKRTEAACKMQLKRVLDKLSGWLSARGCSLSVVALGSLLGSELAKGCPLSLTAKSAAILQTLPSTTISLGPFTYLLSIMKISKTATVGIALLLMTLAIPAAKHFYFRGKEKLSAPSMVTMKSSSAADREEAARRRAERAELSNYPYAYDRLEELYQKYPNLRRKAYKRPEGPLLIEEFKKFIQSPDCQLVELPDDIKKQLRGKKEWNSVEIAAFLTDKKDLIAKLIELSRLPTDAVKFECPRLSDTCPEVMRALKASDLLLLAFAHESRSQNFKRAEELVAAQHRFRDAVNNGPLLGGIVARTLGSELESKLCNLSLQGYEVTSHIEKQNSAAGMAESLRVEFSATISLLEMLDHTRLSTDTILAEMKPMMPEEYFPIKSPFTKPDYRQIQENAARRYSEVIAWMDQSEKSGDWSGKDAMLAKLSPDISTDTLGGMLEKDFIGNVLSLTSNHALRSERSYRTLLTLDAVSRAKKDGLTPQSLQELVPHYLPKLPVDPETQQPFLYNAATREVKPPEGKKRDYPVLKR